VGKPFDKLDLGQELEQEAPIFELSDTSKSIVPIVDRKRASKFSKEDFADRRIIHPGMADIEVLSAFRELRTTIIPRMESFNSVLQISSVQGGGGASFSAINLAVSCTFEQHRHALIVDCNFVRPSLAKTLDVEPKAGLFDFLTDRVGSVSDIVYPTRIPRLSVVPSGEIQTEDHIEFFTGENMRIFLEDVKNRYDDRIIIIDAPPVLESADAKILAEVTDYVLLVLPYKGAGANKVNKIIKAVGNDKVIGVMINN
tara:strand:+ start:683 stop:1450 length:768 start_codon:yes stop_codon:yes gene_type:complete